MKTEMIQPRLLTIPQTAVYLGVSPKTIRNRLARGVAEPWPIRPRKSAGGSSSTG